MRRDALIEHLFRVESLLAQLLQDLVRHDLLALDECVREVVEPALPDHLIELKSVRLEQPERHIALPILYRQRQAILPILVLLQRVALMLTDQVLDYVHVPGVRRQM